MSEAVTEAPTSPQKRVRLRPETTPKLAAIVAQTRWNEGVVLDVLCDEYMANHGISVTNAAAPPNSSKESSQLAVDSVRTDQVPAEQQVQDMTPDDDAGPKTTAGEPRSDASPPEALSPTG